jgi:hypothetical protein
VDKRREKMKEIRRGQVVRGPTQMGVMGNRAHDHVWKSSFVQHEVYVKLEGIK